MDLTVHKTLMPIDAWFPFWYDYHPNLMQKLRVNLDYKLKVSQEE